MYSQRIGLIFLSVLAAVGCSSARVKPLSATKLAVEVRELEADDGVQKTVRAEYTPDQQKEAYARTLLAAHSYCMQSGDWAQVEPLNDLKFTEASMKKMDRPVPATEVLGPQVYRHDGRGFYATPDQHVLPARVKTETQYTTVKKDVRIVSGVFYCADSLSTESNLNTQAQLQNACQDIPSESRPQLCAPLIDRLKNKLLEESEELAKRSR